ncbi:MAG: hypothetical protein HYW26_01315 [Candidatus Aenigmarchaeota archaeon]|nr:hypothetical protein [Candidatus Aenigmarchaeota archaeon]
MLAILLKIISERSELKFFLNPRDFFLQEKGAFREIADPSRVKAEKMDGAKETTDTADL